MMLVVGLLSAAALQAQPLSRRNVVGFATATSVLAVRTQPAFAADSLEYTVLQAGNGEKPQRGQKVAVDYTLWLGKFEGKQVDSSQGSAFPPRLPSPFVFTVGVGEVIPGWDRCRRG